MPFPAGPQYTSYANYVIYFADQDEYDAAVSLAGGIIINASPALAASTFGITFPPIAGPLDPVKGIYTVSYGLAEPGDIIGHPLPSGVRLSPSADSVLVPGQAGNPSSVYPAGPAMLLVWSALILKSGGSASEAPVVTSIPQRRWISGWEMHRGAEGGSGGDTEAGCRDASRTLDGLGWAVRGLSNSPFLHSNIEFGASLPTGSWERFYIRPRVFPSANVPIWLCRATVSDDGGRIEIKSTGVLDFFRTVGGVGTLLGSSPALTLNTWYRIDVAVQYNTGGGSGTFIIAINGVFVGNFTIPLANGSFGVVSTHQSSSIGTPTAGANTLEIDFDDWISADRVSLFDNFDFFMGSHIRKASILAFGNHTNWVGQFHMLNQMVNPSLVPTTSRLTSSSSGATLEGITDETNEQSSIGVDLGVVSAVVGLYSSNAGLTDGTLGYSIVGGLAVTATVNQGAAGYNSRMYRPLLGNEPVDIVPFSVVHEKSTDVNLDTTYGMQASVEHIGTWGLEDDSGTSDIGRIQLLHNCNYANTIWSFIGPAPDGPVAVMGGTYAGNSTFNEVILPGPCHFLWIRPLTGSTGGMKWFGCSLGGHLAAEEVIPPALVRVFTDDTGVTKFCVVGSGTQINVTGVTYQFIAFCDPGMRYNICGAFKHAFAITTFNNPLVNSLFTPDAAFIQNDYLETSSTVSVGYKGPGHSGNTGQKLDGTALPNFGSFAVGQLISRQDSHFLNSSQANYSVWRTADGSGSPAVQILSYIGNGSNPRNITLTPTSEQVPVFVLVVPNNGNAPFFRDPSHTSSDSSNASSGGNSTTAITARGIDQITVNAALNVNLVVYDVFALPGGDGTNGTWYPPNGPVPPGPFPIPPTVPADLAILGEGGLVLSGDPATLLLQDVSGIYTLVPGKTDDTVYDRQTGQTSVHVKIPDPNVKTGFVGN